MRTATASTSHPATPFTTSPSSPVRPTSAAETSVSAGRTITPDAPAHGLTGARVPRTSGARGVSRSSFDLRDQRAPPRDLELFDQIVDEHLDRLGFDRRGPVVLQEVNSIHVERESDHPSASRSEGGSPSEAQRGLQIPARDDVHDRRRDADGEGHGEEVRPVVGRVHAQRTEQYDDGGTRSLTGRE